jgi:hypothetical protein
MTSCVTDDRRPVKPRTAPPVLEAIPAALRELPQWVSWRYEYREGDWTKVPYDPKSGMRAKSNNPSTWTSVDEAEAARHAKRHDGVGFEFGDSGLVGIDLDDCRDGTTGELTLFARDLLKRFPTYAEVSPSGTGVKLFLRGTWPDTGKHKRIGTDQIEVYPRGRYFTVTGRRLDDAPESVGDCQVELTKLHAELTAPTHASTNGAQRNGRPSIARQRIIKRAAKYVAKMEPAVSGQRGHDMTFHVACTLVLGFDLAPDEAWPVITDWNQSCIPPWSEKDLRRKLEEADKQPGERRYLLRTNGHKTQSQPATKPCPIEIEAFRPFPLDTLHGPIRKFVAAAAEAIGCDPSYVALPMLSALAAAIGTTRRIRLKRDWTEPTVIWTAIIGDSGTMKSPAWEVATRPLLRRQTDAFARYGVEIVEYERETLAYEAALRDWKNRGAKRGAAQPEKPVEPTPERYIVADTTVEGLAPILESRPRGVLLSRDELAGWLGSFDQYKSHAGSDTANWLSMQRAGPITIDRKTSRRIIHVPRAAVSVTGGIQPDVLRRALSGLHIEDGLASRLLFAFPPRRLKQWTEATVSEAAEADLEGVFDRLLAIDFSDKGEPICLDLDAEAKAAWIVFHDRHGAEQHDLTGPLAAAWSKLEGYAARLALLNYLSRRATGDAATRDSGPIDLLSIRAGIAQSEWFGGEARRVYALFAETDEDRDRRRLVELIEARGGRITATDLMHASRAYQPVENAEAALEELVRAGNGSWKLNQTGGRPRRDFVLTGSCFVTVTESSKNAAKNDLSVTVTPDCRCRRANQ